MHKIFNEEITGILENLCEHAGHPKYLTIRLWDSEKKYITVTDQAVCPKIID
jgi:hypothetical protein